jgi:hypothetical protein
MNGVCVCCKVRPLLSLISFHDGDMLGSGGLVWGRWMALVVRYATINGYGWPRSKQTFRLVIMIVHPPLNGSKSPLSTVALSQEITLPRELADWPIAAASH